MNNSTNNNPSDLNGSENLDLNPTTLRYESGDVANTLHLNDGFVSLPYIPRLASALSHLKNIRIANESFLTINCGFSKIVTNIT